MSIKKRIAQNALSSNFCQNSRFVNTSTISTAARHIRYCLTALHAIKAVSRQSVLFSSDRNAAIRPLILDVVICAAERPRNSRKARRQ